MHLLICDSRKRGYYQLRKLILYFVHNVQMFRTIFEKKLKLQCKHFFKKNVSPFFFVKNKGIMKGQPHSKRVHK